MIRKLARTQTVKEILPTDNSKRSLTTAEKDVMNSLVEFWNGYVALPLLPITDSLCLDVQNAVHTLQGVMAIRVASRCDPDIWRAPRTQKNK